MTHTALSITILVFNSITMVMQVFILIGQRDMARRMDKPLNLNLGLDVRTVSSWDDDTPIEPEPIVGRA